MVASASAGSARASHRSAQKHRKRIVKRSLGSLPRGFHLGAAVCSYGFAMLAPNRWESDVARPGGGELQRPLRLASGRAVRIALRQVKGPKLELNIVSGPKSKLSKRDVNALKLQVERMLRLRPEDTAVAKRFTASSPELASGAGRGSAGRLFRSPSLFEDLIKTFTLCNCGWSRTISMNEALCREFGGEEGAFPSPEVLAKATPAKLQKKCGVGYRAERIVRLARAFCGGNELEKLEHATVDDARERCSKIFGLGPFGVANVLQLLGHYEDIPADSETARHLRQAHGLKSCTLENVQEMAAKVYAKFAPNQFLRYWTELWRTYEDRMGGRAWAVPPESYALATGPQMDVPLQAYAFRKLGRRGSGVCKSKAKAARSKSRRGGVPMRVRRCQKKA